MEALRLPSQKEVSAAKERLTKWWNGEDLGRPALDLTALRPSKERMELPAPPGWLTDYSKKDLEYRTKLSHKSVNDVTYHAEAFPLVRPDLGPSSLASFICSPIAESPGNVWIEACMTDEDANPDMIELDEANEYWRFSLALLERQLAIAPGIVTVGIPDMGEGLDVLAAPSVFSTTPLIGPSGSRSASVD